MWALNSFLENNQHHQQKTTTEQTEQNSREHNEQNTTVINNNTKQLEYVPADTPNAHIINTQIFIKNQERTSWRQGVNSFR